MMKIGSNEKLLMIGDSITDCQRKRPVGEGLSEGVGKGYVALVDAFVHSVYPERRIRVVNMGTSGNTVRDLKDRWQTDVIEQRPDWLSVMIGINDVWRQYDQPLITESHVYIGEYESTLRELVTAAKPLLKGLVLMAPFYIEPNPNDLMRSTMDRYGQAVKKIAEESGAVFVDTQAAFNRVTDHIYPASLAWDRVHPNMIGHMTLARAFLNAVGFEWR